MKVTGQVSYTKKKQVGKGQGMNSVVYLATDAQFDADIAVKEIEKAKLINSGFFDEAKILFASDHPNVVDVMYAGETASHVFIAMPHYANGSLQTRLEASPLSPRECVRVVRGILLGLASIHQKGFVHFDVKPSNVLFSDADEPLLSDFGQTRRTNSGTGTVTTPNMYPRVFPPEAIKTGTATLLADIYQAGVLLYRMLNGESNYDRQRKRFPDIASDLVPAIVSGKFPDRNAFLPHVPQALKNAVVRALSVDPALRFQSASAMIKTLNQIDVTSDWRAQLLPNGDMVWLLDRRGQPTLRITAIRKGVRTDVQLHTLSKGTERRQRMKDWAKALGTRAAQVHLRRLFRSLG